MKEIKLLKIVGSFAENKDLARNVRLEEIIPAIEKGEDIVLDFDGISGVTQSFVHALISDLFRKYGDSVFDRISFKNCEQNVRKIIEIVFNYMQERD